MWGAYGWGPGVGGGVPPAKAKAKLAPKAAAKPVGLVKPTVAAAAAKPGVAAAAAAAAAKAGAKAPVLAKPGGAGPKAGAPAEGRVPPAKLNPTIPIRRSIYIDDLPMPKRPDLPPRDSDREVFLSKLPKDCSSERLKELIGGFGELEEMYFIMDPFSEFTGMGYARFKSHKEALACVQAQSDPDDRSDNDVVARWSESERMQQKTRSVYCKDMAPTFSAAPGRLLPSLCTECKIKEGFLSSEWIPKVGMMALVERSGGPKQLHFTAVINQETEQNLRAILAAALELFHTSLSAHLESDEAKEILRKRAAGEEEPLQEAPAKKAKSAAVAVASAKFLARPKAGIMGGMGMAIPASGKVPSREENVPLVFKELDQDRDGYLNMLELQKFQHHISVVFKDKEWQREYATVCSEGGADAALGVNAEHFGNLVTDHTDSGIFLTEPEINDFLDALVCRRELIKAVFEACDSESRGCLGSEQLRAFAGLTGFEGDDEEWGQEYTKLCREQSVDPFAGVDHEAFARMVDERSDDSGCYCADEELKNMLDTLEKPMPPVAARVMAARTMPKRGVVVAPPKKGSIPLHIPVMPKLMASMAKAKGGNMVMPTTAKAKPKAKAPPPLDPGARKALCKQVFQALDTNKDETLSEDEMKRFAVLTGFDGPDEVWAEAYKSLIEGHKGTVSKGINVDLFCVLMDDKNEQTGCYTADGELKLVLTKLLEAAARDEIVAKVFKALDRDGDNRLNRQELRKFAEFGGFEGSEETWAEEFDGLIKDDANKGPKDAVDLGFFKDIVNGTAFGLFPDEELHNMLKKWAPMQVMARPAGLLVPREQMVKSLFDGLDADRDGKLNSREMQRFAEFGGFQGPDSQWEKEFQALLKEAGGEAGESGLESVDLLLFTQLINDQSYETGMFTTDEEIVAMLSKLGIECRGESIDKKDRTDLTAQLFAALDQDKDGFLNVAEMRMFAETTGFVGTADEWQEAFQGLCADGRRDPMTGVDPVYFSVMVNDKNEDAGTYCNNDELKESLKKVQTGEVSKEIPKFGEQSEPPAVVPPPEKVDPARKAIIDEMFSLLDVDKDGKLNKPEMRKFAEQTGFEGSDDDWTEGYEQLCSDSGADPGGIGPELFTRLVNDQSEESGCYCNDEELKTVLAGVKSGS